MPIAELSRESEQLGIYLKQFPELSLLNIQKLVMEILKCLIFSVFCFSMQHTVGTYVSKYQSGKFFVRFPEKINGETTKGMQAKFYFATTEGEGSENAIIDEDQMATINATNLIGEQIYIYISSNKEYYCSGVIKNAFQMTGYNNCKCNVDVNSDSYFSQSKSSGWRTYR